MAVVLRGHAFRRGAEDALDAPHAYMRVAAVARVARGWKGLEIGTVVRGGWCCRLVFMHDATCRHQNRLHCAETEGCCRAATAP
jgi:hypothetical protein